MQDPDPTFQWQDPPSARQRLVDTLTSEASQLRRYPKRWAKVATGAPSTANLVAAIKKGEGPFAPAGDFEAKSSVILDQPAGKHVDVYARFVGQPDEPPAEGLFEVPSDEPPDL